MLKHRQTNNIHVVILAAGRATRLLPLTNTLPKCLLPLNHHSIIERLLQQLCRLGLQHFHIVDGFEHQLLRQRLQEICPDITWQFIHNEKFLITNNAYSLSLANALSGKEILLLDSDVIVDQGILEQLLENPYPNAIAMRTSGQWGAEDMKIQHDSAGRIMAVNKHMPPRDAQGESIGVHLFSAAFTTRLFGYEKRSIMITMSVR